MRSICIDGYNLALSAGTGIATYGRNLLAAASACGLETQALFGPAAPTSADRLANEAILAGAERAPPLRPSQKVVRGVQTFTSQFGRSVRAVRPTGDVIWPSTSQAAPADMMWAGRDLFGRARRCYRLHRRLTPVTFVGGDQPDAIHWTMPLPLYARGRPNLYTVHDLIPLRLPHTTLHDRASFLRLHKDIARRADRIIVVSETTRQDVIRLLGVSEERVINTFQSVSFPPHLTNRDTRAVADELDQVFGLAWKGYFLHFGAVEPKKNLGRLAEAYLSSGSKTPLALVGAPGWLHEDETALLDQVEREALPSAQRIRRLPYTSLPLMISLIRGAKAVLFPSLYEGFGLPVLEAMTLSTAVLTSQGGALAEVAGNAALLVDAYDAGAIAAGIRALDADAGLVADLEARGRLQAMHFTPERYRERLALAYAGL